MIIGQFHTTDDEGFTGDIVTLSFEKRGVIFVPLDKTSDKQPDFRVTAPAGDRQVELGSAWKRTSENGADFLSVQLDCPLFAAPVNAALFLDEGDRARLVWSRAKAKPEKAEAPAAKSAKAKKAA